MKEERIKSIQTVRALAFLAIFLSHVKLTATGAFGVSIFFILSGFCLVYAYYPRQKLSEGGIGNNLIFAVSKMKKLYPLHAVTLLAIVAVVVHSWIRHGQFEWRQVVYFISNILMLQSWIPTREGYFSYNAVSWYLSTALILYFIFPTFLRLIKKDWKKAERMTVGVITFQFVIALFLIKAPVVSCSDNIVKWITYICPLYRIGDFLVGCMAGFYFLKNRKRVQEHRLIGMTSSIIEILIILTVALQIIVYTRYTFWEALKYDLYWIPVNTALVYMFSVNKGFLSKLLVKSKVLIFIGDYSAQAFLIHQIVIKFCEYFIGNKAVLTIVALGLTMFSAVLYSKIEKIIINKLVTR